MRMIFRSVFVAAALAAALSFPGTVLSQAPTPQLSLVVDPLGEAFLSNDSSTEVRFQGYLITSRGNLLQPNTWTGIQDQVATNPRHVATVLGQGALFFGEANPGPTALGELNIASAGVLAPGEQFGIGYPFVLPFGPKSSLEFSYASLPYPTGIYSPIRFLDPSPGVDLRLLVDADGSAWLENPGSSPVAFDGYQLGSKSGDLDPTGWMSIADYVAGGHADQIEDLLGSWGLGFHETSAKPRALTELSLNGLGMLQPGARLALGKPFPAGGSPDADTFYYRLLGDAHSQRGTIESVPEPSSFLLAALAGVGLLAFRGRRLRAR